MLAYLDHHVMNYGHYLFCTCADSVYRALFLSDVWKESPGYNKGLYACVHVSVCVCHIYIYIYLLYDLYFVISFMYQILVVILQSDWSIRCAR